MGQINTLRKLIVKTIHQYLNEHRVLAEEMVVYHRSPKKFNKFSISNVGSDSNRQRYGWGLYFSDGVPNNQYGDYVYKVKLFKGKNPVLIDGKKPVDGSIVTKIVKALNGPNKKSDEVVEFSYMGWLFYKTLSRVLGGDKYASIFLSDNGVDGLRNNISGNFNDYILFNDNHITIEDVKYEP